MKMEEKYDYVSSTIDEIALEGLDGITLSALWLRLEKRPHFPLSIDDDSKVFIWNFLSCHPDIDFYELPESRKPLVLYNRYDYVDLDVGVVYEPENIPEEIYPFCKVDENGLKGSCTTFHTRKNVTKHIRNEDSQLMDFQSAIDRWNEKLVIVASQATRNVALLGTEFNPQIKLSIMQYCMLERIGRSRYHGEVTQGQTGLSVLNEPVKSLHYFRKLLMQKQLITKQLHYQKTRSGQTSSGGLLHLKRFYVERRSKMQLLLQNMSEKLCQKPNQREVFTKLRNELGVKETVFKKILQKAVPQYVKVHTLRYREMYPNASKDEGFLSNGNEKLLKVVELVKQYDEAEEDDDNEKDNQSSNERFFNPSHFVYNRPFLSQIYNVVINSGPEGISAQQMGKKISLPKLEMRLLCRNLERKKVVGTFMQDSGRQRVTKYVAKKFEKESESCKKIAVERKKLLGLKYQQKDALNVENTVPNVDNYSSQTVETDKPEKKTEMDSKSSEDDFTQQLLQDRKYTTHRCLRRAIAIIQRVKELKLVTDVHKLQKEIYEKEASEDYEGKIDKKSMLRLIHNLEKDGYIRSIKISVPVGEQLKKLHLVCDPSITEEHSLVKNVVEQVKFRYTASKETFKQHKISEKQKKEINSVDKSIKELQRLCEKTEQAPMHYMPSIGRTYGLEPKFIRMKSLYTFLFYLVYDYQGQFSNNIDGPPIYHVEKGWKMFVPPLPQHSGVPEGWCLISDILLSMPLSILVKVVNITYRIDGLELYLNDPIKQHYLIRHLPDKIRSAVMFKRRYIFAVHDIATKLSFMGLFSFGPQRHKEKDQSFIFVHRRTCIRDTTISKPGYLHVTEGLEYNKREYFLNTLENVESYWLDLETVCLHTPLGSFNAAVGQTITITNIYRKPEMIEASRNKKFDEVSDDGAVPGDKLGAAGLDSALFSHLKRNWSWPSKCRHLYDNVYKLSEKNTETTENVNSTYIQYLLKKNNPTTQELPEKQRRLYRLKRNIENLSSVANLSGDKVVAPAGKKYKKRLRPSDEKLPIPPKRRKPSSIVRTIKRKLTKKRKPYYDDKDKDALKKMSKRRVGWATQEDSILLLCKVTSCLLNPQCHGMVVPYTCVRDFLHEKIPNVSNNKTSRACQRRVRYMLLNPATSANVSVFLTEARQDKELTTLYQGPKPAATNVEVWSQRFKTVLNKLLDKFTLSTSNRCEKFTLPNSLDELHANYQLIITGELPGHRPQHHYPHSVTDIYEGVVYALIMCSLCSVGDKNNWSYVLYKVYQHYPDNMLRSVVGRLRRDQMITKKKHVGKRIMHSLPLSSLPYRLSINYQNALLTHYQPRIYQECCNFLKKLVNNSQPKGVEVYMEELPGYTAGVVALMYNFLLAFDIQIPEQIILLDSTFSDKQHADEAKQMESEVNTISDTQIIALDAEDILRSTGDSCLTKFAEPIVGNTTSDEPPTKIQRIEFERESHPSNDHNYTCAAKSDGTSNLRSSSNISFECTSGSKASRYALYLLRQSESNIKETNTTHHSPDDFVINLCPIYCRLQENVAEQVFTSRSHKLILDSAVISKIIDSQRSYIPNSVPSFECVYKSSDFDNANKIFGRKLYDAIYREKEFGITRKCLWEIFGSKDNGKRLEQHLNYMMERFLVLRVGIVCFQYICYNFCKPWVLSSYKLPKEMRLLASNEMKELIESFNSSSESPKTKSASETCLELDTVKIEPDVPEMPMDHESTIPDSGASSHTAAQDKQLSDQVLTEEALLRKDKSTTTTVEQSSMEVPSSYKDSKESCMSVDTECEQRKRACQRKAIGKGSSVNSDSWERVQFIARSWRKPDGTLNHVALNDLLGSILGYIMTFPGKTEQQICHHFIATLQPVQVLELIEILSIAQCICQSFLKTSHKASLFSKPVAYEMSYEESIDAVCHIEATADAISKFSQLSDVLMNETVKTTRSLKCHHPLLPGQIAHLSNPTSLESMV